MVSQNENAISGFNLSKYTTYCILFALGKNDNHIIICDNILLRLSLIPVATCIVDIISSSSSTLEKSA